MTKKYVKKPIKIEAIQWTGDNTEKIEKFVGKKLPKQMSPIEKGKVVSLYINTLEGGHFASVGDYIIKGIKGEFYPCKEDIFNQTYQEVK
jgi:hypothetical protein